MRFEEIKEKSLTEPFTVLIMGVDSAKDGLKANQAFNGDTLIDNECIYFKETIPECESYDNENNKY